MAMSSSGPRKRSMAMSSSGPRKAFPTKSVSTTVPCEDARKESENMVAQKKKLMHVFNETDKQASIVQEDVCFKETEKKTFLIQEDFKKTHVFWSQQSTPFTVSQASRACRVLARSEASMMTSSQN
jgi:hypothetical protein